MNDKKVVRNRIIKFFSILAIVVFVSAILVGIWLLNTYTDSEDESSDYSIIVDDEITIYEGDTYTIVPYLINKEGTVVESRFDYTVSDNAISVDSDGVITVNSIPEGEVYVTIYERNTSATAEVSVYVVSELTNVLGITFSDSDGNKMLVTGTQDLTIGETYTINVVTEPSNVEIENYSQLMTVDFDGEEKNVFEFTYSKTNVSMTVVGLGTGTLYLNIVNADGEMLYGNNFGFSISMNDASLTEEILNGAGSSLLSKEELCQIETVELSQNVTDLSGLRYLTSLKTVVFTSDETVMELTNISQDYCYRIKTDVFYDYIDSDIWAEYLSCLIPYEESADELYIVYHNDKATSAVAAITYDKIDGLAGFPVYTCKGYTNVGWLDADGNEVTIEQIKETVQLNGMHIYANWEPITYTIVYNIRGNGTASIYEETWYYDQKGLLKTPEDLGGEISITGYKFAGWTTNSTSNVYSPYVQYYKNELVSNLASSDGAIINLYDIWEPIEYTIIFSTVDGMEPIDDLPVSYNAQYTLPIADKAGYKFLYWELSDGTRLYDGTYYPSADPSSNLSDTDGAEIILTPVFEEITYTIAFKLNGGVSTDGSSIVEGSTLDLKYTQQYTLPSLTKEGYTTYSWYCEENGKTYESTAIISREFTYTCTVTFEAIWTSAVYTIYYDCDGGSYDNENYVTVARYWDDGASLLTPIRTGYSFVGWKNADTGVVYYLNGDEWTSNLITSAAENGVQINLQALWEINYYDLTISTGTGTSLTVEVNNVTKTDGTYSVAYNSTITVSYSAKTGYSNATCTFTGGTMPASNLSITTSATINTHSVTIVVGTGTTMTVTIGGNTYTTSQTISNVAYGTSISVSYDASSGYKDATCEGEDYTSMPDYDITISSSATKSSSCIAKGTLIMLSDGTSTAVENLVMNDIILAFDHSAGEYVASRITYIYYEYGYVQSVKLFFSNDVSIELLNAGHGLFDVTMNKYVLISADNASEYVGHEFLYTTSIGGQFVATSIILESYVVSYELVERYDIVTESMLNHIANGLLACSDVLVGVCNTFEFGEGFTYDFGQLQKDIETYGLYMYEEWSEYLSYEDFVAFNGAYFKIALGKGLITLDEIFSLLDDLAAGR